MAEGRKNPFTLDFGREPYEMIPRSVLMDDCIRDFMDEPPSRHISIVTGVRGSGKTVFMTSVCKRFRQEKDWIVVELNPERDLLQNFAAKLSGEKTLREIFKTAQINLSAFGLGLQIEGTEPERDIEVALTRMLSSLQKHHKKVLVAIDEASSTESMKVFASAFQIFLRQDLPLFLLMTGLYGNIRALQDQKTLTFLYRSPRTALTPLNIGRMTDSYARIFEVTPEEALEMARKTKGYSFAFQVLGYFTWEYRNDPQRILQEYKQYLEEYVYEKIWQELSAEDRRVLYGIAKTPNGSVAGIRSFLQMTNNQFTPYRTRLIRKGIINGDLYGIVRFELPLFEQFVLENYMVDT
ncbi:MAG: ATP-binding protein [Clostridia bacterium]|nr:ATP-binding protein [Clostridia bacterium]